MNLIQEKFSSLFSNFEVTTQPRPDGGILLTLRSTEGRVFKRSISYQQLHAGDQLSWVISAIRRDLAEQASELPQISMLQSQNGLRCRLITRRKSSAQCINQCGASSSRERCISRVKLTDRPFASSSFPRSCA